jgi:hypothetical protein
MNQKTAKIRISLAAVNVLSEILLGDFTSFLICSVAFGIGERQLKMVLKM